MIDRHHNRGFAIHHAGIHPVKVHLRRVRGRIDVGLADHPGTGTRERFTEIEEAIIVLVAPRNQHQVGAQVVHDLDFPELNPGVTVNHPRDQGIGHLVSGTRRGRALLHVDTHRDKLRLATAAHRRADQVDPGHRHHVGDVQAPAKGWVGIHTGVDPGFARVEYAVVICVATLQGQGPATRIRHRNVLQANLPRVAHLDRPRDRRGRHEIIRTNRRLDAGHQGGI